MPISGLLLNLLSSVTREQKKKDSQSVLFETQRRLFDINV